MVRPVQGRLAVVRPVLVRPVPERPGVERLVLVRPRIPRRSSDRPSPSKRPTLGHLISSQTSRE